MRVLAIEPYGGGSHLAFLRGWQQVSRHQWTLLTLPAYHWKWRMRHAPVHFASQLSQTCAPSEPGATSHAGEQGATRAAWDVLFVSDMLDLATLLGLAPRHVQRLPRVVYFHENQLTYPHSTDGGTEATRQRDLHFAFSNFTSALAADAVWFNSQFHLTEFTQSLAAWLRRMPDFQPLKELSRLIRRCTVQPPAINVPSGNALPAKGPLHVAWVARWEHDKNPDDFFEALRQLKQRRVDFQLTVLGQSFDDAPPVFAQAHSEFQNEIVHWGYAESREEYWQRLQFANVVVSTASHEFFGLSVLEGVAAGMLPVLPQRLAYPEVYCRVDGTLLSGCFYDGTVPGLRDRLEQLVNRGVATVQRQYAADLGRIVHKLSWEQRGPALDAALERVAGQ